MSKPAAPARTIATVCARGGSKGLPGKNIRPFAGKPLIAYTIEQALACPGIEGVYVSTDDDAIAEAARAAGAIVPYRRPAELATDEAGKLPVIEHLVQHLEQQGQVIARVVDLQPTSPLRDAADIEAALALQPEADLVVTFYNPRSRGRDWQLPKALSLLSEHRSSATPVGVVRNASRVDESSRVTTLGELDPATVDMMTVVTVGNTATRIIAGRMVTPRGYRWQEEAK